MKSDEEMAATFRSVMDRMVDAQWIAFYTETGPQGYLLVWTQPGGERVRQLRAIATSHDLLRDEKAAVSFDAKAHGIDSPWAAGSMVIDDSVAQFWRESVAELGLHADPVGLRALVKIAESWAPGQDTTLTFKSPSPSE